MTSCFKGRRILLLKKGGEGIFKQETRVHDYTLHQPIGLPANSGESS